MDLHLTHEQAERLVAALDRLIEGDRYPLSPRVTALREIRALLKPYPERPPVSVAAALLRAAQQGPLWPAALNLGRAF